MGKVISYCLISGCTPEISRALQRLELYNGGTGRTLGPIVREALRALMDEDEARENDEITIVGPKGDDGEIDPAGNSIQPYQTAQIRECDLSTMPAVVDDAHEAWFYGAVAPLGENPGNIYYNICFGASAMVQNSALSIMYLATEGRMTLPRLWRLAMLQGWGDGFGDVIQGIDYGMGLQFVWGPDPLVFPNMSYDEIIDLEELGNVGLVKKSLIHDGGFWIWMRPDRFPLSTNPLDASYIPAYIDEPVETRDITGIEHLPHELLTLICSHLPLPTLLSLLSASRALRHKAIGDELDRDVIARAWINTSAPWYAPREGGCAPPNEGVSCINTAHVTWAYLRRCLASESMRNRKRIWGVAERLQQRAHELQV